MSLAKRRIAFLSHYDDPEMLPTLERAAYSWLQGNHPWQVELLPFGHASRLKDYDGAVWYYAQSPELPTAAIDALGDIKSFVEGGGKLLLGLIAAKYVRQLGLDRVPDAIECSDTGFFYWNGYKSIEKHPIFEGFPQGFFVADTMELKPMVSARWLDAPPENGRLLAVANWGARFVENERVVVEWDCGGGRVLAMGMHNFRFDEGSLSENLEKLAGNVFRYICSPITVDLTLAADSPEVKSGAGYLGGHYGDGGIVVEAGKDIRALVTGRVWKPLEITVVGRTPLGAETVTASVKPGEDISIEIPLKVDTLHPGEYSAAVEVICEEGNIADICQRFFVVPKDETGRVLDRHWLFELKSDRLNAEIDKGTGAVWGLFSSTDENPVQFAGNPDNLPELATPNHRWLGDLVLKYRFNGDTSWRSVNTANMSEIRRVAAQDDSVLVMYDPGPPEQVDAADPLVSERFSVDGDALNWKIRIKNRSQSGMVLGEIAMPLTLNTFLNSVCDLKEMYERKVMLHSSINGASSWVLVAPLAGKPPYLLIWCKEGTKLEAMAHIDEYGPRPESWEGVVNVFPVSKASRETRCWYEWFNGHSQAMVLPGEELVLNFGVKLIDSYEEINGTLLADGKVAVDLAPGMVLPTDMTGHIRVSCKKSVTVSGDDSTTIEDPEKTGSADYYKFRFNKPGQRNITITDESGEVTNLHFLAIEPIEKLAKANAHHIAYDQQYRSPGSHRDGQFFMWDAEEDRMLMRPRHGHMSSGSDENGFSEPLVLVWKNVVDPNPKEVEIAEYYVKNFLFKSIQDPKTYQVSVGVSDDPDERSRVTRSFNYPHVVNIYFGLSKIAENYGLTSFKTAEEYLLMAYRTAISYFTTSMYKDNNWACGNFGESFFFEIVDVLRAKGFTEEADELEGWMQKKADKFLSEEHPYLSEYPFDTTGYADAYYLRQMAGGQEGAQSALDMIRATRGRQWSWPHYGGDVRWGWGASKYPYHDELCMNYMVPQNGCPLLDAFRVAGDIEDLRLGYGSFLANWSLISANGVGRNLYTWEPQRMTFDPWTSEMGTGIYFTYVMGCSYIVDDPAFGLVGYGCDVEGSIDGHISAIPRDGMYKRAYIGPFGVEIDSPGAKLERIDAEAGGKKIALLLKEPLGKDMDVKLIVRGLPEGNYTLSANFVAVRSVTSDECAAGIVVPLAAGTSVPVHLTAI